MPPHSACSASCIQFGWSHNKCFCQASSMIWVSVIRFRTCKLVRSTWSMTNVVPGTCTSWPTLVQCDTSIRQTTGILHRWSQQKGSPVYQWLFSKSSIVSAGRHMQNAHLASGYVANHNSSPPWEDNEAATLIKNTIRGLRSYRAFLGLCE